jgi:predicted membrane channel-forming protein YqfA (hemolysin III family)
VTILIAGVIVPIVLHLLAPQQMPWWPDTVSLGVAFGVTAGLMAIRFKRDREMNRRLWHALKNAFRSL